MPAYSFQKQFVEKILNGEMPHTIRRRRKHPTKVGDILMLYTGMRTKQCKLIGMAPCVRIEPIAIWPRKKHLVSDIKINIDEFVHDDGFENTDEFFAFFERYKLDCLVDFEIIYWDVTKMIKAGNLIERPDGLHWRK